MLRHLVRRLDENLGRLNRELQDRQADAIRSARQGYALELKDHSLCPELLLDVDSFLVEFRAALELTEDFLLEVLSQALGLAYTDQSLRDELRQAEVPTDWISVLWTSRDLAVHKTSFALAVAILREDPLEWELIVQRGFPRDVREVVDPIDLSWFRSVYSDFTTMLQRVDAWLISKVEHHEQAHAPD
jgi:hypothetical protein